MGKLEDEYEILESLGSGSYAEVFRCAHKKEKVEYAVKILNKRKAGKVAIQSAFNEVEILQKLSHPNIIGCRGYFDSNSSVQIVLELVSGGELFDRIVTMKYFTEDLTAKLIENLLGVLKYMHSLNICHRDLKPENLLMKDAAAKKVFEESDDDATSLLTNIKVVDFGFACYFNPGQRSLKDCCGTPNFIAPEILNYGFFKNSPEGYDEKCDIWSTGVLAYILLCGYPPFHADSRAKMFRKVAEAKYTFHKGTVWDNISQEAKDFVTYMLTPDPNKRPSAAECLQHYWLQGKRPQIDLPETRTKLKEFNAQQKIKGAVFNILAQNRVLYLTKCQELNVKKPNSQLMKQLEQEEEDLTVIDLEDNYLGTKGLAAALATIAESDTVHTLKLANNHIDNAGVAVIVETLRTHRSITSLDLSNNPISQLAGRQLLILVQDNRNIVDMKLQNTHLKREFLVKMDGQLQKNRDRCNKKRAQRGG